MFQMSIFVTFSKTTISRSASTLALAGAMNRRTAHAVLKTAFEDDGLNGKLATHSMRKSFAQRLYDQNTYGLLSEVGEAQSLTVLPPDNQNGH